MQMYLAGHSGADIAERMRKNGQHITKGQAHGSNIYRIFQNPMLIGTKRVTAGGETFDLVGYFPAVLSEAEWSELQTASSQRGRRGGKDIYPHIITGIGITRCGYCGYPMSGQNLHGKLKDKANKLSDGYRRLLCGAKMQGTKCPHPKSRSVAPVERALMDYCSDVINLRALDRGDRSQPLRTTLAQLRAEADTAAAQLAKLMDAMLALDNQDAPAAFARKARELESRQAELATQIAQTEHQLAAAARSTVEGMDEKWRALAERVHALEHDARLQARQLVADTFAQIVVYASTVTPSDAPADAMDVLLVSKSGVSRMLRIDKKGRWTDGMQMQTPATNITSPATASQPL